MGAGRSAEVRRPRRGRALRDDEATLRRALCARYLALSLELCRVRRGRHVEAQQRAPAFSQGVRRDDRCEHHRSVRGRQRRAIRCEATRAPLKRGRCGPARRAFREAERTRQQIGQLSRAHPGMTIADAYAIQRAGSRSRSPREDAWSGTRSVSRRAPCRCPRRSTSRTMGTCSTTCCSRPGRRFPRNAPSCHASSSRLAFVLHHAPLEGPGCTLAAVLAATAHVIPAIEVIDARIRSLDRATGAPAPRHRQIADNAANAAGVRLGRAFADGPRSICAGSPALCYPQRQQSRIEVVSAGVLDHPANGIAWLANKLAAFDRRLEPEQTILSGVVHPSGSRALRRCASSPISVRSAHSRCTSPEHVHADTRQRFQSTLRERAGCSSACGSGSRAPTARKSAPARASTGSCWTPSTVRTRCRRCSRNCRPSRRIRRTRSYARSMAILRTSSSCSTSVRRPCSYRWSETAEQAQASRERQCVIRPKASAASAPTSRVRRAGAAYEDYLQRANDEVCLLVQIESAAALAEVAAIARVDGVDGLLIRPSDLARNARPSRPIVAPRRCDEAIDGALAMRSWRPVSRPAS